MSTSKFNIDGAFNKLQDNIFDNLVTLYYLLFFIR